MAELKTKENKASVIKFLKSVKDKERREDSLKLLEIFKEATKETPKMWGTSIVGFGKIHYKYASGREGDWMIVGFSPRKQALTLYIHAGVSRGSDLLKKLGPHKTGVGCLYIKRLSDVKLPVLKKLIKDSYKFTKKYESFC